MKDSVRNDTSTKSQNSKLTQEIGEEYQDALDALAGFQSSMGMQLKTYKVELSVLEEKERNNSLDSIEKAALDSYRQRQASISKAWG